MSVGERDDAWSFVAVAVEARREGVLLVTEYRCGIEEDCGAAYLAEVLAELECAAIARVRRVTRRLGPDGSRLPSGPFAHPGYHDEAPDRPLLVALRTALEACAVVAATDTLRDNQTSQAEMLDDTRRVWGAFDASGPGKPRRGTRPA
ncbi:MAG: hypothetical protein AVDCRST_MAG18-3057 [uncultured Thermomicrobiales bacterium]|uniref:Uncharacterized protein n=1 Tax=uncultured Thermomicrobiales bacterium TaxID=1645740 RepID=A0A6J4VL86_9BACT|nr:MAG: hypothetical protein AVDCRST_MAG18-3057 [uncultured Thermomicrobiales bacterium]